jgi:hypothetical protein
LTQNWSTVVSLSAGMASAGVLMPVMEPHTVFSELHRITQSLDPSNPLLAILAIEDQRDEMGLS